MFHFGGHIKRLYILYIFFQSGTERNSRSLINSISDIRNENGEIDYKKLYEQQLAENERLNEKLKKSEDELRQTKQTLEKINVVVSMYMYLLFIITINFDNNFNKHKILNFLVNSN